MDIIHPHNIMFYLQFWWSIHDVRNPKWKNRKEKHDFIAWLKANRTRRKISPPLVSPFTIEQALVGFCPNSFPWILSQHLLPPIHLFNQYPLTISLNQLVYFSFTFNLPSNYHSFLTPNTWLNLLSTGSVYRNIWKTLNFLQQW